MPSFVPMIMQDHQGRLMAVCSHSGLMWRVKPSAFQASGWNGFLPISYPDPLERLLRKEQQALAEQAMAMQERFLQGKGMLS